MSDKFAHAAEVMELAVKLLGKEKADEIIKEAMREAGLDEEKIEIPIASFSKDINRLKEQVEAMDSSTERAMSEMAKGMKEAGVPATGTGALIHVLLRLMSDIDRLNNDVAKLTSLIADKD